jgi:hypothetical protein
MPISSNVTAQNTSHPFEDIDVSFDATFDPFEIMANGQKNKDGSVDVKPVEKQEGEPDKKVTIADTDSTDDSNLDEFIDNALKGDKGEENTDEKKDPQDKKLVESTSDVNPNKAYYDLMVSSGLWAEVEGFDGSDEALEKARDTNHEKAIEEDVDAFIENAFEKNPEGKVYGKALLNHLANNGKISDFITVFGQGEVAVADLDNEDLPIAEKAAAGIIQAMYSDKMKPERLSAFIAEKKKKGLLIDTAKDIAPDFEELQKENQKSLIEKTKKQAEQAKINARNYQRSILTVTQQEKVGNITIGKTPQERQEIADYMLQPTVELENGNKTSQFYSELSEVRSNPEWNVVLAKTLREFKNKKPADVKSEIKKPSTKQTITEILEKNKKNLLNTASSENTDIDLRRESTKSAWAGIV